VTSLRALWKRWRESSRQNAMTEPSTKPAEAEAQGTVALPVRPVVQDLIPEHEVAAWIPASVRGRTAAAFRPTIRHSKTLPDQNNWFV
jgi:hypothetical protein